MNSEIISLAKQFRQNVLGSGKYELPEGVTATDGLLDMLREEAKFRDKRAPAAERIKLARFPSYKDFQSFDTNFQKGISTKDLEQLAQLEWIDSLNNVILIGPPGTGKHSSRLPSVTKLSAKAAKSPSILWILLSIH